MQFIYIITLNEKYRAQENWDESANQSISRHFNYLVSLHERGIVGLVGKTELEVDDPENFGLAIISAENFDEADSLMRQDPAVEDGIMSYKLLPFRTVLDGKVG